MLLIRDRNGTVRLQAVKALGLIGDVRSITALRMAQFDQLRSIRNASTVSLEAIHDKNPDIFFV
jgi:HEAT repeat protein